MLCRLFGRNSPWRLAAAVRRWTGRLSDRCLHQHIQQFDRQSSGAGAGQSGGQVVGASAHQSADTCAHLQLHEYRPLDGRQGREAARAGHWPVCVPRNCEKGASGLQCQQYDIVSGEITWFGLGQTNQWVSTDISHISGAPKLRVFAGAVQWNAVRYSRGAECAPDEFLLADSNDEYAITYGFSDYSNPIFCF